MAKTKNSTNNLKTAGNILIFLLFYAIGFCMSCYIINLSQNLDLKSLFTSDNIYKTLLVKDYFYKTPKEIDPFMIYTLPIFLGVFVIYKKEQRYNAKHSQQDLHGTSRWSTPSEIKKEFYEISENNMNSAKKSGIPIAHINGKYYVDVTTTHSLIIGTTRSGKTQTYVLPFIKLLASCQEITSKQSMVINDPKGEILENTYKILKDNGYKIVVLNLRNTSKTSCWNPLSFIITEYVYAREQGEDMSKVNDYIDTMAQTLTYNPKSDPIWPSSAKSLLKAMILYLIELAYEENCLDKVNMYSVYQFFIEYGGSDETKVVNGMQVTVNKLDTIFKNLPVGSPAKAAYATSKFASGDMRSSIFATLSDNIAIFGSDEGIASLTSSSQIYFEDLVDNEQPTAIFMVVPDDRPTRHVIATMFVNQCYTSMVEYLSKNRIQSLPRRINFILDEFASMPRIPGMDNKITVSAGRNMLFHLFIQDLSQLELRYNDESKVIRNSCGNVIYIYSMEPETNKFISELLGSETKEYTAYSGSNKELISQTSYQAMSRSLLTADELSVLDYGETVIKRQRMYPIKSTFDFFYKSNNTITSIEDIELSNNTNVKSNYIFNFKLIEQQLEQFTSEKSSKTSMSPMDQYQRYLANKTSKPNLPNEKPESNERKNPMKIALELADKCSNNEFSGLITKGEYLQAKTLLKRFKIANSDAIDDRTIQFLTNYINGFIN